MTMKKKAMFNEFMSIVSYMNYASMNDAFLSEVVVGFRTVHENLNAGNTRYIIEITDAMEKNAYRKNTEKPAKTIRFSGAGAKEFYFDVKEILKKLVVLTKIKNDLHILMKVITNNKSTILNEQIIYESKFTSMIFAY